MIDKFMKQLKLFTVEFDSVWPVPNGLIILAYSEDEAWKIAERTIKHTKPKSIHGIVIDKPKVVFFEPGEY
jgi:hypothetical protein